MFAFAIGLPELVILAILLVILAILFGGAWIFWSWMSGEKKEE